MTITELRELTIGELEIKILELKKDLMDSRFLLATSQVEDTSVFKKIKKQIAQTMTVLNEKVAIENINLREEDEDL
ncbi:MAG: 50S ribosomal protein L29 [Candidatus Actinomarinales bacterium]|nr:MAG: 50S ribosomal protein L29 [Candidatus Actinomarinales bacterium]|tara:strand:- start:3047 stop:3274 length:228 start_codon:yes stop_codon:yes gene_type:complete